MTITPLSPHVGTMTSLELSVPQHILADPEVFERVLRDWRNRQLAGKVTQNDHQLVTAWLAQCSPTGSEETVKTYHRHIERFRLFVRRWNEVPLKEQTDERLLAPGDPETIEAFVDSLRTAVKENQLSPSTFNVCVAAISSFYKWASQPTRRGFTGVPLSPVPSGLQLQKQVRKAKALSHEQLHGVLHGARQCRNSASPGRDALMIRVVYLLGTRATETVSLRWSDIIQLESGPAVHVRAETAKGKKERFIPIDTVVLELLDQLKKAQPASDWLLPNLRHPDRHVSRQGLWKICSRAGKQAGVKFWPHCARHTHATHSWALTKDAKLIQTTLGHADISTTMGLYVDETNGDSSTKHLTGGIC